MNYKIIDNFLDKESYNQLTNLVLNKSFNWFYAPEQVIGTGDLPYHYHTFYNKGKSNSDFSNQIKLIFIDKLDHSSILNCRVNLSVNRNVIGQGSKHTDTNGKHKTAIYYYNTNNGGTKLFLDDEIFVSSKENRLLIFDSNIQHCAVYHNDTEYRIVINTNYF